MEPDVKAILQWARQVSLVDIKEATVLPNSLNFIGAIWPGRTIRQIRVCPYPSLNWKRLPDNKLIQENDPSSDCKWVSMHIGTNSCLVEIRYTEGGGNVYCFIPSASFEDQRQEFSAWVDVQKLKRRIESLGVPNNQIERLKNILPYRFCYQACLFAKELLTTCNMNHAHAQELLQQVVPLPPNQKRIVLEPYPILTSIPQSHLARVLLGAKWLISVWENTGLPPSPRELSKEQQFAEELRRTLDQPKLPKKKK